MAYRDIEMWRQILESEESEKKAYDEACEKRAGERREMEEKEFWECDQKQVDPATMAETPAEGLVDLEDVEDPDEEIDFSGYGVEELREADMREPLTAVSAALGAPASTANLEKQDCVVLAEALERLAGILKGRKLEEAGPATDAGWLAWAGKSPKFAEWDDETKASSRKTFDELVKAGKVDGATGDSLAGEPAGKKDFAIPGGEKDEADSKAALAAAERFYGRWLRDPDFRERNALKDKDGATVMKPANPEKPGLKGAVVAGTDPESAGAKEFAGYFARMTPEDREEFDSWARKQNRYVTKHYAPHKFDSLNRKGTLHGAGDDDENVNPLAQHGLDQTFNADNADDDMYDDPENGEEFYSEFNPDYQSVSHEGVADQILAVADQEAKRLGMTREQYFDMFKTLRRLTQIKNTVRAAGKEGRELTNKQLEFVFDTMDDRQLADLRRELEAEAGDDAKQKQFIDFLFRTGKNRQVNLKDILKQYGIAADQSGDTGAGTQQGDVMMYVFIVALAEYYGVMTDEAAELWRVKASQAPTKRDRELGVEPRKYARHLACAILQDLYDELHAYQMKNAPRVVIPQSPAEGPKIRAKEWADVQKKIAGLLLLIELAAPKAETREVWQAIKAKFDQYNGAGGEKGEREARKLKTYLSDEQQEEFQALLKRVREDFGSLSDDEKIRIIELDRMRLGDSLTAAQGKARKAFDAATAKNRPGAFDEIVKKTAKGFLAGGSANTSRDGIDVTNPSAGADNGHNRTEA